MGMVLYFSTYWQLPSMAQDEFYLGIKRGILKNVRTKTYRIIFVFNNLMIISIPAIVPKKSKDLGFILSPFFMPCGFVRILSERETVKVAYITSIDT
jgi:hypothetical protein